MTLLISIASKYGVWQAADRRYAGHPDAQGFLATKMCRLETPDSKGVIGYSGFGANVMPSGDTFELSEWIKRTLRGQKIEFNVAMSIIKAAASKNRNQLLRFGGHAFVYVGFHNQVPTIDYISSKIILWKFNLINNISEKTVLDKDDFNWRRVVTSRPNSVILSVEGSGRQFVESEQLKQVCRLVGKSKAVQNLADRVNHYLARIIREASKKERGIKVSPECLSVCLLPNGSSWHHSYDASGKKADSQGIPTVANGKPVDDIVNAILPAFFDQFRKMRQKGTFKGQTPDLDEEEINRRLKNIETEPDDSL